MQASNLKKRRQTWYVRVGVNPKYHKLLGRTETVRSLGTRDKSEAVRRSYAAVAEIRAHHDRLVREAEAGITGIEHDALDLRRQIADGEMNSDDAAEILHESLEAKLRSLGLTDAQIEGLSRENIVPAMRSPFKVITSPDRMPLSAAVKAYLDDIEDRVIRKTWTQKQKQLDAFVAFAGDIAVASVDRPLALRYIRDSIRPAGYSENYATNIIAILVAFFNWAIDESLYTALNPFARTTRKVAGSKKGSTSAVKNRAWRPEELSAILESLESCKPGSIKHKAAQAARIALYTGMRQEEVCTLRVDSVSLDDGYMAVEDAKNQNSIRQVPIPSPIRPLIEDLVKSSDDDYLIPDLPTTAGKRGHTIGTRFGDVKRELFPDSEKNELTFHGLRSTYMTAAEAAGIPETTTQLLVGHKRQNLAYGLYSRGPELEALATASETIASTLQDR